MRALDVVFFLSGAAGLVWESIWGRSLHLVFGTSQFAIATVLAAFMSGLAVGGAVAARVAPRIVRPLRAYAALEAVIGVFALAFPFLLDALAPIYTWLWRATTPGPVAFGAFQFALVALLLLLPTAAMGATLPILLRLRGAEAAGAATGRLYGLNTAGAVAGVWLAGFWLLPGIGVAKTTLCAAAVNFLLAGIAWRMDRGPVPIEVVKKERSVTPLLLVVAALAGASSLAMEVTWFRLLTLILGGSVYAFTVMLLAFLAGIAGGGALGGPLADRLAAENRLVEGVVIAQFSVAGFAAAAMWFYSGLPLAFVRLYWIVEPAPWLLWPMKCLLSMALMTPSALFMGLTFPLLVRLAARGDLTVAVGQIYAANTLGAIVGAFGGGFLLLPRLHVLGTTLACIGTNLFAAALVSRRAPVWGFAGVSLAVLIAYPPRWDPMWMTTGVYKYVDNLQEPTLAAMRKQFIERYRLLFYEEGLTSVVTVAQNRVTGNIWLANNGKIDASTTTDMPTQVLVSHLPMLFVGQGARDAVVIGLASGVTLGALTLHPEIETIDVVEIEPAIQEAAEYFSAYNHRALHDPRVRLIANDGRNQLYLTHPGTYDVIVSEPSNPWLTGVSNLFTREFFEMGRERLKPGGVWSQWVQMYGMDSRDLRSVMKTFCAAFPYVRFFSTIRDADLVMIGSESPLHLDDKVASALVRKNVGVESELSQVSIQDGYDLVAHYLFDRDTALSLAEGIPENTDDNMLVEFSAPRNLHRETSSENFLMLLPRASTPVDAVSTADGLVQLADAYQEREDTVRALIALKEAERREPGREDVLVRYTKWQKALRERVR